MTGAIIRTPSRWISHSTRVNCETQARVSFHRCHKICIYLHPSQQSMRAQDLCGEVSVVRDQELSVLFIFSFSYHYHNSSAKYEPRCDGVVGGSAYTLTSYMASRNCEAATKFE